MSDCRYAWRAYELGLSHTRGIADFSSYGGWRGRGGGKGGGVMGKGIGVRVVLYSFTLPHLM